MEGIFELSDLGAVATRASGIPGTPTCEALAEAGATVVISSRQIDRCEAAAARLPERGSEASAESLEQADERSVLALRDRVFGHHQQVDILVDPAVSRVMKRYRDPLASWRGSMRAHATGLFRICRALLGPTMKRSRGSRNPAGSIQGVVAPRFDTCMTWGGSRAGPQN